MDRAIQPIRNYPPPDPACQYATRRNRHGDCFKQRASCADLPPGARPEACTGRRTFSAKHNYLCGHWKLPRLSPFTWAFILRVLWLCGYSRNVESASTARIRASTAAKRLQSLASDGPVLLLGHGFMNRMIANQLVADGWARQKRNDSQYWSATVYQYDGV